MFLKQFIQQLSEDNDQYVSVLDLIGEQKVNQILQTTAAQHQRVGEKELQNVRDFIDSLYVKVVARDQLDELEVPNITNLAEFEKKVRDEWRSIEDRFIESLLAKSEEDFPVFVDTFRVGGLLFALRVEDKVENLEEAMNLYVEMEEYERAAEIRDELERLGSDKIVST